MEIWRIYYMYVYSYHVIITYKVSVKIHKLNKKSQIRKEKLQKAQESLRNKEKISERRKKIHCSKFLCNYRDYLSYTLS